MLLQSSIAEWVTVIKIGDYHHWRQTLGRSRLSAIKHSDINKQFSKIFIPIKTRDVSLTPLVQSIGKE